MPAPDDVTAPTVVEVAVVGPISAGSIGRVAILLLARGLASIADEREIDLGDAVKVSRGIPMVVPLSVMAKPEIPAGLKERRENRPKQTRAQFRRAMKGKP